MEALLGVELDKCLRLHDLRKAIREARRSIWAKHERATESSNHLPTPVDSLTALTPVVPAPAPPRTHHAQTRYSMEAYSPIYKGSRAFEETKDRLAEVQARLDIPPFRSAYAAAQGDVIPLSFLSCW